MGALTLRLPFTGSWRAELSPANRVPSHGTTRFGVAYAIDFVGVGPLGHSAPVTWRTLLATEDPTRFPGFGRDILAPVDGVVVACLDGEPDHEARRSLPTLLAYALTQRSRARGGARGLAGNHVAIEHRGALVVVCHLQRGSVGVRVGDRVEAGQVIGRCGNSGNSTEPHVHLHAADGLSEGAQGLPIRFALPGTHSETWVPMEGEIVDAT